MDATKPAPMTDAPAMPRAAAVAALSPVAARVPTDFWAAVAFAAGLGAAAVELA